MKSPEMDLLHWRGVSVHKIIDAIGILHEESLHLFLYAAASVNIKKGHRTFVALTVAGNVPGSYVELS